MNTNGNRSRDTKIDLQKKKQHEFHINRCHFFVLLLFRYPFYGVQFHPEKNIYEWVHNKNIPHGKDAIAVGQYFESFFVNQCRMNGNRFSGVEEENEALIYNYPVTFTARLNSSFEQTYLFKPNVNYPHTFIEAIRV